MDITIHSSFLPQEDPEATVGPADQPGTSIVLYPPAATPGITEPYGVRDCAIRDPAGNMIRIQEIR